MKLVGYDGGRVGRVVVFQSIDAIIGPEEPIVYP